MALMDTGPLPNSKKPAAIYFYTKRPRPETRWRSRAIFVRKRLCSAYARQRQRGHYQTGQLRDQQQHLIGNTRRQHLMLSAASTRRRIGSGPINNMTLMFNGSNIQLSICRFPEIRTFGQSISIYDSWAETPGR